MDRPENPMVITGLLAFQGAVQHADLEAVVRARLLRFHRFAQRVVSRGARRLGHWADDPRFRLESHVQQEALPAPADDDVLRARVSAIMSTPLAMDRAPWTIHHLTGFQGEKSVLVCRLHHCIADGFALMHVMMSMTDDDPREGGGQAPPATARRGRKLRGEGSSLSARARDAAERIAEGVRHLLFMPRDPPNLLRGPLSGDKRATWSGPIPLERIKRIGRAHGGTVNDVLLAGIAGALRRHAIARGVPFRGPDVRAVVPVALREPDEMESLGNEFGLVFLELPVGTPEPQARLRLVEERIARLKRSAEPVLAYWILAAAGIATHAIENLVVRLFASKTSLIVTNVPGPTTHRWLAGHRIDTIMFWVPQSASVSAGVSLFSYAGEVRIGVATDAALVPDPAAIVAAFLAELDALE
jgi:diacylglycerol O-acyltransferase